MFCLYCGINLPDDAIFCNKCGKQQHAVTNESKSNITILPFPTASETPISYQQPPTSNVPMVRGTPSVSAQFPGQKVAQNAADSASSTSLPPSSGVRLSQSLPPTQSVEPQAHQLESHSPYPAHLKHLHTTSSALGSPISGKKVASGGLKFVGKLLQWQKITIVSSIILVAIVISVAVIAPKLTGASQTAKTVTTLTSTSKSTSANTLCSGDTSGGPMTSGKIDSSHPFHQDDGQAAQGDGGGFTPVTLCTHITASSYAINFHATSPYMLFYLYDSKHAKYEIDYNIYPDHISVISYPGFSTTNSISVGNGTYSSANWHTYRIEFTNDSVRVLVDGTQVLSGSAGFTDDGTGDNLLLQAHQITMDQFSVTQL